jgi:UDP-N-acetylmuramoyl-L-alanyl-D-glutamate--2,6-diaminopimelate ligase
MKNLSDILSSNFTYQLTGSDDVEVNRIVVDSREVQTGDLFVAIRGSLSDGHLYIQSAIEKGASCICSEEIFSNPEGVTSIVTSDTHEALGHLSSEFYDKPSTKLKLVGITGTNGKTTVATLLFNLFKQKGNKCGLISTVENLIDDQVIQSTHTTPDAVSLNSLMADMVDYGCTYCFMEVSSHAIHQKRIAGLHYDVAVFTNITHDHLDYHKTFSQYIGVKKSLFDRLDSTALALVNKDDKNGLVMTQNCKAAKYTYSLHSVSDFKARIIEHDFNGMLLKIDSKEAWFQLVGKFNAYNLLAAYGTAFLLGMSEEDIITSLSSLQSVSGRFEYTKTELGVIGVIDYAHTPDALKNVLETINAIRTSNEQLITVVGCGGNRDHDKRPIMAATACKLSSKVILTSDNPRNENPEAILADMQTGVKPQDFKKVLKITDREEAIKTALSLASSGDIILLAGKGHETYQDIKGVKHPFDDKKVFTETANKMK